MPPAGRLLAVVAIPVLLVLLVPSGAGGATPGAMAALVPDAAPWNPDHTSEARWPVGGLGPAVVLRGFDPPAQPWLPGHRGVDLLAEPGEPVVAALPGVVTFASGLAGRGVVSVTHADGLRTTYEPVSATTSPGEPVAAGSVLGILEPLTTHCGRPCLHWGLVEDRPTGDVYLDPLTLVDRGPPVLLPYGPPVDRAPPPWAWQLLNLA